MLIYIENLSYYNQGIICGGWFQLGQSNDVLERFLTDTVKIDRNHEEYFIADTDYEDIESFTINPYSDIFQLNSDIAIYDNLEIIEQELVNSLLESGYYSSLTDALEEMDNYLLIEGLKNEYDVGFFFLEECDYYNVPEQLKSYIDYNSFGRDVILGGDGVLTSYGFLMPN